MTGPAVTMSRQMNESESQVGGFPSADPLLSESKNGGPAAEPEVEVVDGLPVLAEVRTVERAAPALAATENVTVPGPVPDALPVTASQLGSLLAAVHAHHAPVETPTDIVVAAAEID